MRYFLEIEENLKITIHEIVFKMHLEKASYDKAVDDIKNIFNMLRIRVQSMEDAIRKIKENPLAYSNEDYKSMMEGNLDILNNTKKKFIIHREMVNEKINEFIEHDIHIKELNKEEEANLNNLRIIEKYLSRTIDEDQRVLKKHFDLKDVYGKELENISKMSLIERFNFRTEVYDKILDNPNKLEDIDIFLRPLFKMQLHEFKHESLFKEPIKTLKTLIGKPKEFKEQLNLVINSYKMIMEKLMTDIELIEKEEGKILESILEYIKDVHENIEKIDDNSSITIGTKRLKMLNISVTDWKENKEIYKVRLKEYIEKIRGQSIKALEQNEDIEDIISNNININKLYDEVVGIGNVNIKLYKIEEDKQRQITWNEVSKNSGGEGFLSAFVILSSLLSYMRKDESDIFSRKESGKVLIMDNPFAQTSSAHLLKPLIDIAKKSNTQLICLTGLGGDSIYNRFDNIYVLNLISSKLNSGVKYLRSEHTKGEEEKEVLVASRFKIEEQIKLF